MVLLACVILAIALGPAKKPGVPLQRSRKQLAIITASKRVIQHQANLVQRLNVKLSGLRQEYMDVCPSWRPDRQLDPAWEPKTLVDYHEFISFQLCQAFPDGRRASLADVDGDLEYEILEKLCLANEGIIDAFNKQLQVFEQLVQQLKDEFGQRKA